MSRYFEALRRLHRAADKAVRRAVVRAPLVAAFLGGAIPARAASQASLNIIVKVDGISNITDLTAVTGASTGTIDLTWTEPFHSTGTAPFSYDVRVSTAGEIPDDTSFSTTSPLSVFSPSAPPTPGPGGGPAGFVVAGLTQNVTYYFAIREKDSTTFHGSWVRSLSPPLNVNNYAIPILSPPPPSGGRVTGVGISSITAAWNVSFGATDYLLVASTSAALPPTAIAASSSTAASSATVFGLAPNTTYFLFGMACGDGCSQFGAVASTITLAAPVTGLATTSISSSTIGLSWGVDGNPAGTSFLVDVSTDGVTYASVLASTYTAAAVNGLKGGVTYYLETIAVNGAGIMASPSNVAIVVTPGGPVPSTPSGLTASGGLLSVSVTWNALPPALQGAGLEEYRLLRSTNSTVGFVQIATTTGVAYMDVPLAAGVTEFYKIIARDIDNTDSAPSAPVSAVPFTKLPMEPIGLIVTPSSAAVTFSWSPTSRFFDGTAFVTTGTPTADELQGYSVYRSTDLCSPAFVQVSSMPLSATSLTDNNGGVNYYYRLYSFNTAGFSPNPITVSSLGEFDYFVSNCSAHLVLDSQTAASLAGSSNGIGNIRILPASRPQDVGNGIFQSAQWEASLNGGSALQNYVLPKPGRIVLGFAESNGAPVPSTGSIDGSELLVPEAGAPVSVNDLGVYWNNNQQYVKMYGKIDPIGQTVTVNSPNLGVYQIRAQARSTGAVFDVSNLSSRVITPNGDGLNDTLIFTYDPGPNNVVPNGQIFDLRGAYVANMTSGLVPNTLTWNGFMNGMPVRSGVYVYRITGDGKTFTGTIVVAR